MQKILKSPLLEILKFLDEKELCRMQKTSQYLRQQASQDFLWRFLL
jgi:hypothetical protein